MSKTKNVKYNLELFHSRFIQRLPEDFGISTTTTGVLILSPHISLSALLVASSGSERFLWSCGTMLFGLLMLLGLCMKAQVLHGGSEHDEF